MVIADRRATAQAQSLDVVSGAAVRGCRRPIGVSCRNMWRLLLGEKGFYAITAVQTSYLPLPTPRQNPAIRRTRYLATSTMCAGEKYEYFLLRVY